MNNNKRKPFSLSTTITVMVVVIILLATVPVGFFAYINYREDVIAKNGERAVAIAQSLARFIDPDEFISIMNSQVKNDYYLQLHKQFDQIRDDVGALFLFSGIAEPGIGLRTFIEGTGVVDLGDIFPAEAFPQEFFNAQKGIPASAGVVPTGVDDLYAVAAYVPIIDNHGNPVGVVGININVTDVFISSNAFARTMFLIVSVVIMILIWLPIFWVRFFVGKPLQRLCDASDSIANGHLNIQLPSMSSDEFNIVVSSLHRIKQEIVTVIEQTRTKSLDIIKGNIHTGDLTYTAKGDFKKIIENIDDIAKGVYQYLHDSNCTIAIFDDRYRFTYINGFAQSQGYNPDEMLGKSVYDVMPANEAAFLRTIFKQVDDNKNSVRYPIEMVTPDGIPYHEDQTIIPIMDNDGTITAYLLFGYVTTQLVEAQAELSVASKIQQDMLPSLYPAFPNCTEFDIYASMLPAKGVGGDFYDYFMINDNTLAVVIADVSDSGVPAALFMVITKTLIKNNAQSGKNPKEVFETVNKILFEYNKSNMFVTAFLGYLDIPTGIFTYVNAGHSLPLWRSNASEDRTFNWLKQKTGFVLAGMENTLYTQHEIKLVPGDELFLYTDGVTEATNPEGDFFGDRLLKETVSKYHNMPLMDFIFLFKQELDIFVNGDDQADDISMLILRYGN